MKLERIMIAAPKSGSGKTTITCALLQALKKQGKQMAAYKCGPDYIDPMFHRTVIGVPSGNLDTFFTTEEETNKLLLRGRTEKEFAVLEGVMGLYDGLGGIREEGSSYHLAKITKTPIVLTVDAKGMGRSMIAMLAGFLQYDTEHLIQGVLLNKVSKHYYEIIKPVIEEELPVKVVGYCPDCKDLQIESRHLGLVMPGELQDRKEQLAMAAEELMKTVSLEAIVKIAEGAAELAVSDEMTACREAAEPEEQDKPVIAVARDEAFCFYYEDNLRILQEKGAKLVDFSPLHDTQLPAGCCALLIGGGYPELYAKELSQNERMRKNIKCLIEAGMPVVAECGGYMYLHTAIRDTDGISYPMVDVIEGTCFDTGKLVRFGYIELQEKQSCFLPKGERIKGHEFHYYDSTAHEADCFAIKPMTERKYSCIIKEENKWLGFAHLYYPSNPAFAKSFVERARIYGQLISLF